MYEMSSVWRRLKLINFDREVQEVSLLMLHNKLPVQERLFRINLSRDPYCPSCSVASIQDIDHYFTSCEVTNYFWCWIKNLCLTRLGSLTNVENASLLKFNWPKSRHDREIVWLISHYIFVVWDMLHIRKLTTINDGAFFGYMRYKYKEALDIGIISHICGLMQ